MPLQPPAPSSAQPPARSSAHGSAEASQRLASQLHVLSQVVETITYRLLDLEEQALALHQRLESLSAAAAHAPPRHGATAEAEQRLEDTEERLLRIESMLSRTTAATGSGHLSVVGPSRSPASATADQGSAAALDSGALDIDGPFPEEPEQPFLDDLLVDPDDVAGDANTEPGFLTA